MPADWIKARNREIPGTVIDALVDVYGKAQDFNLASEDEQSIIEAWLTEGSGEDVNV